MSARPLPDLPVVAGRSSWLVTRVTDGVGGGETLREGVPGTYHYEYGTSAS